MRYYVKAITVTADHESLDYDSELEMTEESHKAIAPYTSVEDFRECMTSLMSDSRYFEDWSIREFVTALNQDQLYHFGVGLLLALLPNLHHISLDGIFPPNSPLNLILG